MPSERILITGANGYIGTHIIQQALQAGHSVRAVVRSQAKIDGVKSAHPAAGDKLDFAIVADIKVPGAFDEALKSSPPFTAVIHAASDFSYGKQGTNAEIYLEPALKGTRGILESVKKVAPSVKKVVITSSFAAMKDPKRSSDGYIYSEKDWDPLTYEDATDSDQGTAYLASKTIAERAAWDFHDKEKPNFDVMTIQPPMVYGPIAHSVKSVSELNTSTARIYKQFIAKKSSDPLPDNGFWLYVDVRDVAEAHLIAITNSAAANKRIFTTAGQISSQQISDILREAVPELADRTPIGKPGTDSLPEGAYGADNSFSKTLGIKYHTMEQTLVDLAKQCLLIEAAEQK